MLVSLMTTSLFYIAREDGTVTGPHHPSVIRRELDEGTVSLDTQAMLQGTEDWVPIIEWGTEIVPAVPRPKVSGYAAALPVERKSAGRMFWGIFCVVIGIIKCTYGLLHFREGDIAIPLMVFGFGMLWGIGGTAELIRQSRRV